MDDQQFASQLRDRTGSLPVVSVTLVQIKRRVRRRVAATTVMAVSGMATVGTLTWSAAGSTPDVARVATPTSTTVCRVEEECFSEPGVDGWTRESHAKIQPIVDQLELAADGEPSLARIDVDYAAALVEVYWHGEITPSMHAEMEEAEVAGVEVRLHPIPYQLAELADAAQSVRLALTSSDISVNLIGPAPDYASIQVAGPDLSQDAEIQYLAREIARRVSDVPLTFVADPGPVILGGLTSD